MKTFFAFFTMMISLTSVANAAYIPAGANACIVVTSGDNIGTSCDGSATVFQIVSGDPAVVKSGLIADFLKAGFKLVGVESVDFMRGGTQQTDLYFVK